MDTTSKGANKKWTAKSLAKNEEVRKLFVQCGRNMAPIIIQRRVEKVGQAATYMNCVSAFARLKNEFYGDEYEQYTKLMSYVKCLNGNSHVATCEANDGTFQRLAILYREGIRTFSQSPSRGMSVDGAFLKTFIGGMLLVARFLNGNDELQIIGAAVVPIENEDNWTFFLKFLTDHLPHQPLFVASGRDKGLAPAVKSLSQELHHFFCFHHLMENFNRKFKSELLKNAAWSLARSFAESDFNENEKKLRKLSNAAADWLLDIGEEKWSLCYSPCSRYGMLTSNSVESINDALRGTRKLPILDCLLSIERYVGTKWSSSLTKAVKWNELTGVACMRVEKALSIDVDYQVASFSDSLFLVVVYTKKGDVPIEHTVQLNENAALCACGYQKDTQSPCTHAFVCMRVSNRLGEAYRFFDTTWRKAAYVTAYSLSEDMHWPPPVIKSALAIGECAAPTIKKKRGRPKGKKRRESQFATLQLSQKSRKLHLCSVCRAHGHNKRFHEPKASK